MSEMRPGRSDPRVTTLVRSGAARQSSEEDLEQPGRTARDGRGVYRVCISRTCQHVPGKRAVVRSKRYVLGPECVDQRKLQRIQGCLDCLGSAVMLNYSESVGRHRNVHQHYIVHPHHGSPMN